MLTVTSPDPARTHTRVKDALAYISSPQPVQVTSVTRPGSVTKVGKQMSFASKLDIPSGVMAPGKKLHRMQYELFGMDTGPTEKLHEEWIQIDNELVSDMRPEDMIGMLERDNQCAYPYLLFYQRTGIKCVPHHFYKLSSRLKTDGQIGHAHRGVGQDGDVDRDSARVGAGGWSSASMEKPILKGLEAMVSLELHSVASSSFESSLLD
ncbi:hypothetical protein L210DRAFT_3507230 [Boletus edulis BED1]|uniref:Uncharacterized protein n=1 Tax=Boletus edulis BED1 TaxID=1328754 RepID=A0AAD4BK74_BOLED|nr:hypothetical protein L210DRAFT_3507230 [Boletus edulis BED1]